MGSRATLSWELWNLRALDPMADTAALTELRRKRANFATFENEAMQGIARGERRHLEPGRRFLQSHPELAAGLVVSMHVGPYQFLPEPFLAAGISPAILLDRRAHAHLGPRANRLRATLGYQVEPEWLPVEGNSFVRQLVSAVRGGRPVLVYLDGNGGLGGSAQTRAQGLTYQLPGRAIRVRTGIARLACRLGCPVHPVTVRWTADGGLVWHKEPSQRWSHTDDPDRVTQLLYDWVFHEVITTPEQWFFWEMLKDSYACFAARSLRRKPLPPDVRRDFARAFRICLARGAHTVRVILTKEVEVWPGDVLVDLTDDRFFTAEGVTEAQLDSLRDGGATLIELADRWGKQWVSFHALRLCLLQVARLGGR